MVIFAFKCKTVSYQLINKYASLIHLVQNIQADSKKDNFSDVLKRYKFTQLSDNGSSHVIKY